MNIELLERQAQATEALEKAGYELAELLQQKVDLGADAPFEKSRALDEAIKAGQEKTQALALDMALAEKLVQISNAAYAADAARTQFENAHVLLSAEIMARLAAMMAEYEALSQAKVDFARELRDFNGDVVDGLLGMLREAGVPLQAIGQSLFEGLLASPSVVGISSGGSVLQMMNGASMSLPSNSGIEASRMASSLFLQRMAERSAQESVASVSQQN